MGDMKTPDFDDLLAAFDMPDIDAQEAIQSNPAEQRDGGVTNAPGGSKKGTASCFPNSEPPVVSVIVKNTVRSESTEEKEDEERPARDKTDNPPSSVLASQVPVKLEDFTSELEHKLPANPAAMEPQITNGFEEADPTDPGQANTEPWSKPPSFSSTLSDNEGDAGPEPTTDVIDSLSPLLYPQTTSAGGTTRSSPRSPPSLTPRSSQPEKPANTFSPPALHENGRLTDETKCVVDSEDESDPDFGSPLVIQESPESMMFSPPKRRRREKVHPDLPQMQKNASSLFPQPPNLSAKPKSPKEENEQPDSPITPPQPLPSIAGVKEEKYPEHVIDERDSPESPPPSETGVLLNRNGSPDVGSTKCPDLNQDAPPQNRNEPAKTEHSEEEKSEEAENLSEKRTADEEKSEEGRHTAGENAETPSPLRPLKVKIKMPTGSITRTVTNLTPKRVTKASFKDAESSKPSPESQTVKSKKKLAQQTESPATALRDGVSTVKERKQRVSPTAVSITKTTTLPPVSSSSNSRDNPGAINLRSLGKKTLNSGVPLPTPLAPQTSNRPASIVNSTGAIISKSQTNLVEAFNKILNNKNLLPCYKPDLSTPVPAEWGISLPAQGYRCLECGDAFALEHSLAQHYDRRSLRIEVTCNHCAKRLAFFNKCSLLLHAREHKEKGLIMQCSHLVMKPVPVEQMISQPEPTAAAGGQVTLKLSHQAVPSSKETETQQSANAKCSECQAQFGSKEEIADHFQEIKPAKSTSCTECSPPMLLPNSCSAAAHQRIHQSSPPYVCPECGVTIKQQLLQKHLQETCLHFSRRIGYRCSSCLVVFGGLNSVKSHIQSAHCDMFHKCPRCPMAFKSAPSIQTHLSSQHADLTNIKAMLIYKCVMCDTVYTHKPLLYSHFDTHLTNQKVHVFKCPECTKLFSQRNSLLDHFKTHKTSTLKEELHSSQTAAPHLPGKPEGSQEWIDKDKVKTERMKAPSVWKCRSCNLQYTEREEYIAHMGELHGKFLKKFPCNKCESSFTTTSSMRRHIRDKHKVMNRGFRCQYCSESKKTFSSRSMLERHMQMRHSMTSPGQDSLMEADGADSSSEQDSILVSRRRRRAAVKMEQEAEATDTSSPVKKLRSSSCAPASYTQPESGFSCAPCGFTTEDKPTFLEHISQHRRGGAEGGGLQCLQCGACFTSPSSLSRHRFIIHKVKDACSDSQQTSSVSPSPSAGNKNHDDRSSVKCSEPASPSGQPLAGQGKEEDEPLACKVCGRHFEKSTDLNTHFRTHGMAFIIARNAGKTT
ncbi:PREDICTED: zinc finger protein 687-like [Cyprinodon variegatus]|uniref:Zinc finger protein 687a n=1 Tax=Cyprinodon variegatus TaxID=28743 RepID=A0A3Q2FD98_CYPVA|nr:PREDICTED: zinc finger protein 687-like [Cyprinodon variegatus]